jgi:hypothetical protein
MPLSDVVKIKISKQSLYSLFLASLGLAIISIGLAFLESFGLLEMMPKFVEGILTVIIIIGAIIFASGIVYNGFFGALTVGPIYVTGKVTRLAEIIFQKKIFLIPIALTLLVIGIFVSRISLTGEILMILFLLTIFILNLPFLVSYYQLIKNNYLQLRYISEELDQLNKKTLYYSILKEIEEENEFKTLVKLAEKDKDLSLLKRVLFQEINHPYLARETVTVLLLNNVLPQENPPEDFSESVIFWQEKINQGV